MRPDVSDRSVAVIYGGENVLIDCDVYDMKDPCRWRGTEERKTEGQRGKPGH